MVQLQQAGVVTSHAENMVTIYVGNEMNEVVRKQVASFYRQLMAQPIHGVMDCIPAMASVTVYVQTSPRRTMADIQNEIKSRWDEFMACWKEEEPETESSIIEIPVCYGGEYGPDLEIVAKLNELSVEEVVRIHSGGRYPVHMLGFAPGFPYLGGMSPLIATPRKQEPRVRVPAGSVGIAGKQTGIYSITMPGGWQLIGRTPLRLFNPQASPPSLLTPGDIVMFVPITKEEFLKFNEENPP